MLPMIIIAGAPRSGTTLTARVFEACGADFRGCNSLMEHPSVSRYLKSTLKHNGYDFLAQNPIPTEPLSASDFLLDMEITKECKFLLFWESFKDAKWIFVRRDMDAIVDSCMRTGFMKAYKTPEEWEDYTQVYLDHMEKAKEQVDYIEVWPKAFKEDKEGYMEEAVIWAGYEWKPEAYSVVKQSLLR